MLFMAPVQIVFETRLLVNKGFPYSLITGARELDQLNGEWSAGTTAAESVPTVSKALGGTPDV